MAAMMAMAPRRSRSATPTLASRPDRRQPRASVPTSPPRKPIRASHICVSRARIHMTIRKRPAGIEVTEARITHLAYAPEIASAMLRRQQAQAIIAARKKIVEGAVDMVKDALDRLQSKDIPVDEERRAALASNLLDGMSVVLRGWSALTFARMS